MRLIRVCCLNWPHCTKITNQPAQAIAIYREFPDNPGAQERMGALLTQFRAMPPMRFPRSEAAVAKSPTAANRVALAQAYVKNEAAG